MSAIADFALAHETPWPRDILAHLEGGFFEAPPDNALLGPVRPRGGPAGIVEHAGRRVAEWGDTARPDMTFSVAKSYLAILAGIAQGDGVLPDLDEPVRLRADHPAFTGPRNGRVTWRHLLTNTSEWEGSLWGKSDLIDRGRNLGVEGQGAKRSARALLPPGEHWEYNDVRVNALALALLLLFRRPLPEVWAERVMRPLGASDTWEWRGYSTSALEVDGRMVESVSGGGHWGGGVVISAEDQWLVARMVQRGGMGLVSGDWLRQCRTPCALNPHYGFLFWLNSDGAKWPAASRAACCFSGAGGNVCLMEPEGDVVAVARWLDPGALDRWMRMARNGGA